MERKKLYVVIIHIIIFIILFAIFLQASRTTWDGYLFTEDWDVFSTKTGYSDIYHGDDDNIWINETRYFSKCYIQYNVNTKDGFLVGNAINLNISYGFVEFYTEGIPDVDNITIRIDLEPGDKITEVNAIFDGNKRFEFENLNLNVKIKYVVSGPKGIRIYAIYNDSNLTSSHIVNYGAKSYVDVEPAYTTTQLKLAKSVVILTYWVIFFSVITMLFKVIKSYGKKLDSIEDGSSENMLDKILKYFPNGFYFISVFIIALGIILAVLGAFFYGIGGNEFVLTGASILITLGVGCFSLGFAFLSIGIAKESDKKMVTIGKANFMGIDSSLKNVTINNLNNLNDKKIRCLTILSWRTGLIQAERLREYANDGERDSMIFPFITVMEGLPWGDNRLRQDNIISNVEVDWIINVYKSIRRLNPSNGTLEKLQQLFEDNISPILNDEAFNQLLDLVQEIVQQHPKELFQRFQRIE